MQRTSKPAEVSILFMRIANFDDTSTECLLTVASTIYEFDSIKELFTSKIHFMFN